MLAVFRSRALTVHTACHLTRLLVAPPDGSEVRFVVEETTVEEWLDIWVLRRDMNLDMQESDLKPHVRNNQPTLPRLAGYSRYWNL